MIYPNILQAKEDALSFSRMNMNENKPLFVIYSEKGWEVVTKLPYIPYRVPFIALNGDLYERC